MAARARKELDVLKDCASWVKARAKRQVKSRVRLTSPDVGVLAQSVLSVRFIKRRLPGRVITSSAKTDQRVPFFMTPSLGSGSSLRAYPTRRFRGEDTLLLQAEWRIMVNRFMDTAIFYDAGKAVEDEGDLDFNNLKSDVGFGFRFHSPFRTLLRTDVAKGSEGYQFVMSVQPVF